MADPQLIQEWLNRADEDFGFADSVIEESPYFAQICFHFHQAAEKYLKAYIIAHDLKFEKIHDLPVLLKTCMQQDPGLQILLDDCKFLNRYYIEARYPVHWPTRYDKEETQKAKLAAEHIRNEIRTSLRP
jgi:HEPN domain-containing protein